MQYMMDQLHTLLKTKPEEKVHTRYAEIVSYLYFFDLTFFRLSSFPNGLVAYLSSPII